jgi:AbrB family looped-hinge helix DNA binding protein
MLLQLGSRSSDIPIEVGAPPRDQTKSKMRRKCQMHWQNTIVMTAVTIDKAGRIVLPKSIREELQLSPGDALEVDSSEKCVIRARCGEVRAFTRSRGLGHARGRSALRGCG